MDKSMAKSLGYVNYYLWKKEMEQIIFINNIFHI